MCKQSVGVYVSALVCVTLIYRSNSNLTISNHMIPLSPMFAKSKEHYAS